MRRKNMTNEDLKECIADSLLSLMKDKNLDDITISEITSHAGIGRASYYRNFSSKADVLYFKLEKIFYNWVAECHINETTDLNTIATSFFSLLYTQKEVISIMFNANQSHIFQKFFYNTLTKTEADDTFVHYKMAAISCMLFGIIIHWTQRNFEETPEEMSNILTEIVKSLEK